MTLMCVHYTLWALICTLYHVGFDMYTVLCVYHVGFDMYTVLCVYNVGVDMYCVCTM